jgi:hypothetical protein
VRRLAHLSDLHFGRVDPAAVDGLRDEPNAYNLITIDEGRIGVEVHAWDGRQLFAAVAPVVGS